MVWVRAPSASFEARASLASCWVMLERRNDSVYLCQTMPKEFQVEATSLKNMKPSHMANLIKPCFSDECVLAPCLEPKSMANSLIP